MSTPRCNYCASKNLRDFWMVGAEIPAVECLECGAIEDDAGEYPELDALEELTAYFAEAPIPEAPPDFTLPLPARTAA